jgi:hypothetical protein
MYRVNLSPFSAGERGTGLSRLGVGWRHLLFTVSNLLFTSPLCFGVGLRGKKGVASMILKVYLPALLLMQKAAKERNDDLGRDAT